MALPESMDFSGAKYNELLEFPNEIMGLALNLEEDNVAAVILGDYQSY